MKPKSRLTALIISLALLRLASAPAQTSSIKLDVDASDAARYLLHARLNIPAQPGKLTLLYPKWLPGEHGPDGPITDLVGLKISADGKPVDWRRDAENMCAFHLTVPADADAVDVSLDFLLPSSSGAYSSGVSSTAKLLDLSWNQILLYPQRTNAYDTRYAATLRLPDGWQFGTALPVASSSGTLIQFSPVSLETLVDSPVIAGEYFRSLVLAKEMQPAHKLDIVADSAAALEIKPADEAHFSHLVMEANALFGAHHYRGYHFLLTLSDRVAHFGLEHHESSDNRRLEKFLTDEETLKSGGSLLPHEMTHSWNGKYRRPAGLATPDFEQPMQGELLWVYEGLTTYLGNVLATRCGLWTNANFYDELAYAGATLDRQSGRNWRSLADTAVAAQLLYKSSAEGTSWRRKVDFYPEGALIWMEVDTIIRQQSSGRLSLDDFCKKFYGGESGPPKVVPYMFDDVITAMNEVAAYNWREFFQKRIYEINPRAPLGGIENSGWHLAYTNKVPAALKSREGARKFTDLSFSLGLLLKSDGSISDVLPGSPADKAGIGSAMKLIAVNGRAWTPEILRRAVSAVAMNREPLELLMENGDYFKTCKLNYHGGEKYPYLERIANKPDLLAEILKPLTPEPLVSAEKK